MKLPCVVIIALVVLGLIFGSWAFNYVVDFWAFYLTHKHVIIPFLPATIGSIVLSEVLVPLLVITWICSFFL